MVEFGERRRRTRRLVVEKNNKLPGSQQVAQTLCVSRSDKLISKLIKTDVFFDPVRGLIRGVNKNPNNLITNKPILEIEKKNKLKSRVYSIGYTQHPGIDSARKRRDKPLLLVRFLIDQTKEQQCPNAPSRLLAKGFLYCFVFSFIKFGSLVTEKYFCLYTDL